MEVSEERYRYLTLCEKELSYLRIIEGICPNCHRGLIMEGYVCNNCRFNPENN